jgi:hypothetical protein
MKTTFRFMGIIGSLAGLLVGGNAYANGQVAPDDPPGRHNIITNQELPDLPLQPGRQYSMKFVTPHPGTGFEIGKITPDPGIDYKIGIAGPKDSVPVLEKKALEESFFPESLQPE